MELHMMYEIKTREVILSEVYISLSTQLLHVNLTIIHTEHMSAYIHIWVDYMENQAPKSAIVLEGAPP
jgi:hypothetical protein